MITVLRAGNLALNLAVFGGVPLLLGLGWTVAAVSACACLALSWWACALAPRGRDAPAGVRDEARGVAARLGAPAPRFVRLVSGWTAAAVRTGRGYGVLLGEEVAARHREALLAHEMAHFVTHDLHWEPFTDGPARLLLGASRRFAPALLIAVPFLLLGAPLSRVTERRADRLAARIVTSYAAVLGEVAARIGAGDSLLHPSLGERIRSARDVIG